MCRRGRQRRGRQEVFCLLDGKAGGVKTHARREVSVRIADLLRQKSELLRSIDRHVTVSHAIRLMAAYNVGALLVFEQEAAFPDLVHGSATALGIVSEREIMSGLAKRGAAVLDYQVAEIMAVDVPVVLP